ncbi:unnamed protein product, partial [Polarella glacialis]
EPVGKTVEENPDSDGPIRLQAPSGVFAEIRIPKQGGETAAQASCGGIHGLVDVSGGRKLSVRHRVVDFRPPTGCVLCTQVKFDREVMAELSHPRGRCRDEYIEAWTRLCNGPVAALELVEETRPEGEPPAIGAPRAGYWLFCGDRFARVIGPPRGSEGLVAGTCCKSLAQLEQIAGAQAVGDELRSCYEASWGRVEGPGRLRLSQEAWAVDRNDQFLYDQASGVGGSISFGQNEVVHRLPSGLTQRWRIRDWGFDPFRPFVPKAPPTLVLAAQPAVALKAVIDSDEESSSSCSSSASSAVVAAAAAVPAAPSAAVLVAAAPAAVEAPAPAPAAVLRAASNASGSSRSSSSSSGKKARNGKEVAVTGTSRGGRSENDRDRDRRRKDREASGDRGRRRGGDRGRRRRRRSGSGKAAEKSAAVAVAAPAAVLLAAYPYGSYPPQAGAPPPAWAGAYPGEPPRQPGYPPVGALPFGPPGWPPPPGYPLAFGAPPGYRPGPPGSWVPGTPAGAPVLRPPSGPPPSLDKASGAEKENGKAAPAGSAAQAEAQALALCAKKLPPKAAGAPPREGVGCAWGESPGAPGGGGGAGAPGAPGVGCGWGEPVPLPSRRLDEKRIVSASSIFALLWFASLDASHFFRGEAALRAAGRRPPSHPAGRRPPSRLAGRWPSGWERESDSGLHFSVGSHLLATSRLSSLCSVAREEALHFNSKAWPRIGKYILESSFTDETAQAHSQTGRLSIFVCPRLMCIPATFTHAKHDAILSLRVSHARLPFVVVIASLEMRRTCLCPCCAQYGVDAGAEREGGRIQAAPRSSVLGNLSGTCCTRQLKTGMYKTASVARIKLTGRAAEALQQLHPEAQRRILDEAKTFANPIFNGFQHCNAGPVGGAGANASLELMGRIHRLEAWEQAHHVSAFLAHRGVTGPAEESLKALPVDAQRMVLAYGPLMSHDPSGELLTRVRDVSARGGAKREVRDGRSGGSAMDAAEFCKENKIDVSAEDALKSLSRDLQEKVMCEGPVLGTKNPSAVMMSRIRRLRGGGKRSRSRRRGGRRSRSSSRSRS